MRVTKSIHSGKSFFDFITEKFNGERLDSKKADELQNYRQMLHLSCVLKADNHRPLAE